MGEKVFLSECASHNAPGTDDLVGSRIVIAWLDCSGGS